MILSIILQILIFYFHMFILGLLWIHPWYHFITGKPLSSSSIDQAIIHFCHIHYLPILYIFYFLIKVHFVRFQTPLPFSSFLKQLIIFILWFLHGIFELIFHNLKHLLQPSFYYFQILFINLCIFFIILYTRIMKNLRYSLIFCWFMNFYLTSDINIINLLTAFFILMKINIHWCLCLFLSDCYNYCCRKLKNF